MHSPESCGLPPWLQPLFGNRWYEILRTPAKKHKPCPKKYLVPRIRLGLWSAFRAKHDQDIETPYAYRMCCDVAAGSFFQLLIDDAAARTSLNGLFVQGAGC
jgi:hypothetical protein